MKEEILVAAADDEVEFSLRIIPTDRGMRDMVPDEKWREFAQMLGRRLPPRALRALYDRFNDRAKLEHAARIVGKNGGGNTVDLQRALHVGWVEARRLMKALEAAGVVERRVDRGGKPEFKLVDREGK